MENNNLIKDLINFLIDEKIIYNKNNKLYINSNCYEKISGKENWLIFLKNNYPNFSKIDNLQKLESLNELIYRLNTDKNNIEIPLCPICNKRKLKFIPRGSLDKKYQKTCGNYECTLKSREQTCLEKYGKTSVLGSDHYKVKSRETCLQKYGETHSARSEIVKRRKKETNLKNHGGVWNTQTEENKEKCKQTCLEKYSVEFPMQNEIIKSKSYNSNVNNHDGIYATKLLETKEKTKQTCLEKYGVEFPGQYDPFKEKGKQTCLEKYGTEYYFNSDDYKKKVKEVCNANNVNSIGEIGIKHTKETLQRKYGVQNPSSLDFVKLKKEQTCMEHYGVKNPSESLEIHRKKCGKYLYQNIYFDSSWELAFYIYCIDHNIPIIREPIKLQYKENNKIRSYYPDFKINNSTLIEIKGNLFINEKDQLIDPYKNKILKEKYQCMINNNVKLITSNEIKKYTEYVNNKYGKKYLKSFKI